MDLLAQRHGKDHLEMPGETSNEAVHLSLLIDDLAAHYKVFELTLTQEYDQEPPTDLQFRYYCTKKDAQRAPAVLALAA